MVRWRALGVALAATAAACVKPLETPPCLATQFTQAPGTADTIVTSRGLKFIEVAAGTGAPLAWCTPVSVDYDGYLLDSTKFDSSRDLGVPLHFVPGLGSLIDGFEQGVIGMQVTGKRRLIVPPELGYGSQEVRDGQGTIIIPANSTLVFDIELLVVGP
jgi:peptidylprolyl isomerase